MSVNQIIVRVRDSEIVATKFAEEACPAISAVPSVKSGGAAMKLINAFSSQ